VSPRRALTRRGSFPARRKNSWEEGPGGVTVTSVSSVASVILGSGAQVTQDGLTLVRTRGLFTFAAASVGAAATDQMLGAVGIGVVTAEAFAIGVTAVPVPITTQGWDGWIYWSPLQLSPSQNAASPGAYIVKEVDSRAMRKLRLGDTIYAALQISLDGGTLSYQTYFDSRLLLKLA